MVPLTADLCLSGRVSKKEKMRDRLTLLNVVTENTSKSVVLLLTRTARLQKWVLIEGEAPTTQVLRDGPSQVVPSEVQLLQPSHCG